MVYRSIMKMPNPIDTYVGARVRTRRLVMGMSQSEVGAAANLSFQQIQKYEKGLNRISASRLQQLADLLAVTPAYFFEDASVGLERSRISAQDKPQSQCADALFTSECLYLSRAFAAVRDAGVRKIILDLIVSLALAGEP
jgi:transcriptional regulator with XRE-family HTH domain